MPDMTSLREALANKFTESNAQDSASDTTQSEPMAESAPQTAGTQPSGITNTAPQPDMSAQNQQMQMMNLITNLQAQNQQLQNALQQQSQVQQESMITNAMNSGEMPVENPAASSQLPSLNFAELQYMSPSEQSETLAKYTAEVASYAEAEAYKKLSGEFAPIREDFENKRRIADMDAARSVINNDERFKDFADRGESIDRVIKNTKALDGLDPHQQYLLAGLISRGIDYQQPKEMTTQELIDKAMNNPEVMKAISQRNASDIQSRNSRLPKLQASSGMSNANAIPENRPSSMDDVRTRMKNAFGI